MGMEVARSTQGIFSSQRKLLDLLKKTWKLGWKPTGTLFELNWKRKAAEKDTTMDKGSTKG